MWHDSHSTPLHWLVADGSNARANGLTSDIWGKCPTFGADYTLPSHLGQSPAQAKAKLERFKIGADTEARKWYEQGKLPPAHLHARAKRYAVKLFLSHYHGEAYRRHFGTEPPLPYPIAQMGHAHLILPPD